MQPNDKIALWAIVFLFFLAFVTVYRKWTKTGNPQLKFAGRIFLAITVGMGIAYLFIA